MLNIIYEEPDEDRWLPLDRYPRRVVRRLVRGPRQPGGMERYFLNLIDGLQRTGIPFRAASSVELRGPKKGVVGIIGKGHLLRKHRWRRPIIFGPAVFSHPIDDPTVFREMPIKKVLVSCEWLKNMYASEINVPISVWAAGIDSYGWSPSPGTEKDIDVLVYDKVRWRRETYENELIAPICECLDRGGLRYHVIRYGFYKEEDYRKLLRRCRSMIFLVEHETQGFAYLQALSSGIPVFAWNRGGYWQDPDYYPERVKFGPVTSVPYWDECCGNQFSSWTDFEAKWGSFWELARAGTFEPRKYILENLTLEKCAREYSNIVQQVEAEL